jgi:hypothetical protein
MWLNFFIDEENIAYLKRIQLIILKFQLIHDHYFHLSQSFFFQFNYFKFTLTRRAQNY